MNKALQQDNLTDNIYSFSSIQSGKDDISIIESSRIKPKNYKIYPGNRWILYLVVQLY